MPSKTIAIAVVGDSHCGSTLGLCPEEGVKLPEGGRYIPSHAQLWLWEKWLDYWAWVEEVRSQYKAKLYGIVNGDAVDGGAHHGQVQFITADSEAQAYIATAALDPMRQTVRKHKGKFWFLKGTRVHVGSDEEALAKWFGAEREPETDAWARYILKLELYGVRIDVRHHMAVGTSRPWLEGNPANIAAAMIFVEHARKGRPHPHLALRSHKHKTSDSFDNQPTRCICLPAWQLATDFVHKIAPESIADIGGVVVVVEPDGRCTVHKRLYTPDAPPTYRE